MRRIWSIGSALILIFAAPVAVAAKKGATALVAGPTTGAAAEVCEAVEISAEQIERNGHYLTALKAQLYEDADTARQIGALVRGGELERFALATASKNGDTADFAGKVALEDFQVAVRLRDILDRRCGR